MAEPMTDAELAGTELALVLGRDFKPEVVDKLLATIGADRNRIAALKDLIGFLRPHCRYVDMREANEVKSRIASALSDG